MAQEDTEESCNLEPPGDSFLDRFLVFGVICGYLYTGTQVFDGHQYIFTFRQWLLIFFYFTVTHISIRIHVQLDIVRFDCHDCYDAFSLDSNRCSRYYICILVHYVLTLTLNYFTFSFTSSISISSPSNHSLLD